MILICTDCGVAIHVMDAEAHSLNCKATPRFPLPSQVGYHSDGQDATQSPHAPYQPVPLAITYPSPVIETGRTTSASPGSGQKKVRKRRLKTEPPDQQLLQPKIEPSSDVDELAMETSPIKTGFEATAEAKLEPVQDQTPDSGPVKKKAKVILPSLDVPRGVRTILPGKNFRRNFQFRWRM